MFLQIPSQHPPPPSTQSGTTLAFPCPSSPEGWPWVQWPAIGFGGYLIKSSESDKFLQESFDIASQVRYLPFAKAHGSCLNLDYASMTSSEVCQDNWGLTIWDDLDSERSSLEIPPHLKDSTWAGLPIDHSDLRHIIGKARSPGIHEMSWKFGVPLHFYAPGVPTHPANLRQRQWNCQTSSASNSLEKIRSPRSTANHTM